MECPAHIDAALGAFLIQPVIGATLVAAFFLTRQIFQVIEPAVSWAAGASTSHDSTTLPGA
jgi:hypothetical protein